MIPRSWNSRTGAAEQIIDQLRVTGLLAPDSVLPERANLWKGDKPPFHTNPPDNNSNASRSASTV
jgi:hypothetical protein